MQMDDLKKLATGNSLFNLRKIISPKLVTILYFLGLAAILLWAVAHFFSTFRFGFGTGLWGLLEIVVYGLLSLVGLRIACEAVLVYFASHSDEAEEYAPAHRSGSLIDDVRDAIEDLAESEEEDAPPQAPAPATPKTPDTQTPPRPVAGEPTVTPEANAPKPESKPVENKPDT